MIEFHNFNNKMAYERLTSFMAYHNIPPDQFNHFDYVDAL